MNQPVVTLIAAGPDETVPAGILWESAALPSLNTDEVKTWVAENRQGRAGSIFVMPGMEVASKGTPSLTVNVSVDEYLALTAAIPR